MRGVSWLAKELLACQEGLWSVKLGKLKCNLTLHLFQKSRISMSGFRYHCRVKDSRLPNCISVQQATVQGVTESQDFRLSQRYFGGTQVFRDVAVSLGEWLSKFYRPYNRPKRPERLRALSRAIFRKVTTLYSVLWTNLVALPSNCLAIPSLRILQYRNIHITEFSGIV